MTALTAVSRPDHVVHRWRAFAVLAVAVFMEVIDLTITNVALPTIGRELHFSETNLQWVITAYAITFGGFLLLGGRAADLFGRRRIVMLGLAVFTGASLACALATSEGFLIAMRGLQGIGAAIVVPSALSIVTNLFEEGAERNKALGAWGAIAASGATFGVVFGGLLTRYLGWQYIFYLNVPIGSLVLLLIPRMVPESKLENARRRFDPLGALTVTTGLLALVYALSKAPQDGWGATRTIALLAGSAVLLVVFLIVETRVDAPMLPMRIFKLRTLAGANAVGLLLGASFFGLIFIGTLYMQQVLGYSALQTGLAWLVLCVPGIAAAGLAQAFVTRGSAKTVLAAGMAMVGGASLWATTVPVHGHLLNNLAGPFAIAGVATAFTFIPISIAGLAGVSADETGLASGLLNTSQRVGGAVGVAVASTVFASHYDTLVRHGHANTAALTGGFQWALWVCGAIGIAGIPLTLLLVRRSEIAETLAQAATPAREPALAVAD